MTRRILKAAALSAAAGTASLYLLGRYYASPPYRGALSDHFDGERFLNPNKTPHGLGAFLRWVATRQPGNWPSWIESTAAPAPPRQSVAPRITFINHSTVLIQVAGLNILTDPIWSERTSPVGFAGPMRHRAPGITFHDLPPIDVVAISHNHYDHLDAPTLRRLVKRDRPLIVAPLGNAELLQRELIGGGRDFDWWESVDAGNGITLHCTPANHFSSRGIGDRDKTLWCGWMISSEHGNIYFAGDTGFGTHFEEIGRRFAPIRFAMLPIGAFRPEWFMSPVHISPSEAVRAHQALRAERSMPIHFGTFALGDDGFEEPLIELARAKREAGLGDEEFMVMEEGHFLEL